MNKHLKTTIFLLFDTIVYIGAWALVFALSSAGFMTAFNERWLFVLVGLGLLIALSFILKTYSIILRFAGFTDSLRIIGVYTILGLYHLLVAIFTKGKIIEDTVILTVVPFLATMTSRFVKRVVLTIFKETQKEDNSKPEKRVMIVGAGHAGSMLIREMQTSYKYHMKPVCVIDDDKNKLNNNISGVRVVANTEHIVENVKKYAVDQIIIAMPSAKKKDIGRIAAECQKAKCDVKIVPGMYQFTSGQVSISNVKPVSITDLLGREQVNVNLNEIMGYIESKTVLVTGGGGSIGSELCRQIAEHNPKELIILDIYENNAYDIQQELLRKIPNLNLTVLIASVRDKKKIEEVFKQYKPQIVFHAAAHKHVPLMETSPCEAVKNNVGGTLNVATMAGKYKAERFILISTDKAVNPTNVMGATKRICEMIIQTVDKKYETDYVAVRFGNVLGSNGSVIPLFKKQIKAGGPVTVTHKDIVRYFMTIPEAVSLVLQAGAYAKGGEIFVLDMGEPVRIYDLAENMIRLSGFEPHSEIEIAVTGLRPGEKLYEERLMAEEGLERTENKMISIGKPLEIDEKNLFSKIKRLEMEAIEETEKMKELVHELVPSYKIDVRT